VSIRRPAGHRWEGFKRQVFAYWGDVCWLPRICGHGGSRQVDHVEPVTEDDAKAWDIANCRPAHGAPGNACQVCTKSTGRPTYCNQLRGAMSPARARKIIAERTARRGEAPESRSTGYTAAQREPPGPPRDPGRAW
jgi:hypothetical protein